ncbi:hypothetical protein ABK040_009586 [Willaertia magna]
MTLPSSSCNEECQTNGNTTAAGSTDHSSSHQQEVNQNVEEISYNNEQIPQQPTNIPCKYFLKGHCRNTSNCPYLHISYQDLMNYYNSYYYYYILPTLASTSSSNYQQQLNNYYTQMMNESYPYNQHPITMMQQQQSNIREQSYPVQYRRNVQGLNINNYNGNHKKLMNNHYHAVTSPNLTMYSEVFEEGEEEPLFYQPKVCTYYTSGQGCKYGYHCKFFHPTLCTPHSTSPTSSSKRNNLKSNDESMEEEIKENGSNISSEENKVLRRKVSVNSSNSLLSNCSLESSNSNDNSSISSSSTSSVKQEVSSLCPNTIKHRVNNKEENINNQKTRQFYTIKYNREPIIKTNSSKITYSDVLKGSLTQ